MLLLLCYLIQIEGSYLLVLVGRFESILILLRLHLPTFLLLRFIFSLTCRLILSRANSLFLGIVNSLPSSGALWLLLPSKWCLLFIRWRNNLLWFTTDCWRLLLRLLILNALAKSHSFIWNRIWNLRFHVFYWDFKLLSWLSFMLLCGLNLLWLPWALRWFLVAVHIWFLSIFKTLIFEFNWFEAQYK